MSDTRIETPGAGISQRRPVAGSTPQAELIAQSLKTISRRSRKNGSWVAPAGAQRRWHKVFPRAVLAAFVLVVLIPNILSTVYLAFIASDQYVSETRFAVRGGERGPLDGLGGLIGMQSVERLQDSMIVSDYIKGRAIVEELDKSVDLRRMFAAPNVDFLSRFDPSQSIEELVNYWRWKVSVSIDSMSGIITVLMRSFSPEDSLKLSQEIIRLSEKLVNELSERARQDSLRQAQLELTRANENLQDKIAAMRDLRDTEGVLDSAKTSEVMTQTLADLRLELIKLEQDYSAQRRSLLPTSPQLKVLEARIESMKEQVRKFEALMTAPGSAEGSARALSQTMGRFDIRRLERDVAEKQYIAAAAAYERARVETEAQHVYLATFLQPVLAQEALYPKRLLIWSIILAASLLLWGGGVGTAVLIRDHVAL